MALRFDDTLQTVLSADLNTPIGVQSVWRQLVDLVGRRRVPADVRAMSRLRSIRDQVPVGVRSASARALEFANPPSPLVRLFALDDLRAAMPVLRSARMTSSEWIELLPDLAPPTRAVLRNRRDLGPAVKRALESFGPIDFVLSDQSVAGAVEVPADDVTPGGQGQVEERAVIERSTAVAPVDRLSSGTGDADPAIQWPAPEIETEAETAEPIAETAPRSFSGYALGTTAWPPFEPAVLAKAAARFGGYALGKAPWPALATPLLWSDSDIDAAAAAETAEPDLSFIAFAEGYLARPAQSGTTVSNASIARDLPTDQEGNMDQANAMLGDTQTAPVEVVADGEGTFEIADVVARIDAFWRNREEAPATVRAPALAESFRFETDAAGIIRWVDGVSRAPVIGLALDLQHGNDGPRVDGVAGGAFRRRASFANARMVIEGGSDAAGDWRISAVPVFDPANGRFTGYRGTSRRPRADERAEPAAVVPAANPADSLRQLVHELRTPTNAIAGFAEMIETQMLGPVADPYRERATDIRVHARELLGAIDDLDLAARIDSAALALMPGRVALRPLLTIIADDLAALVEIRGSSIALPIDDVSVSGDRRAVERLLARLLATLVSASGAGERICVRLALDADDMVVITLDRPRALADYPGESVLGIDDEHDDATLLGTGFALRLARNLARELGGGMVIGPESLTLRLPAAVNTNVDQAHLS